MRIATIEQFFPRPRMRLVKVTTDDGLVGWGEATLEGKPKSTITTSMGRNWWPSSAAWWRASSTASGVIAALAARRPLAR